MRWIYHISEKQGIYPCFFIYKGICAAFKLIDHKVTLIEIAPGIDLQTEVLDQMDFVPAISPDLKIMDEGIVREKWGELDKYME